jgi:hypothetical protein
LRHRSSVEADWDRLKSLTDPHRRGYEFQRFIGSLFHRRHYSVTPNPGAGGSRQVDLMATMGDEAYLIEVKWWNKPLGLPELQDFKDRLKRTPPSVIGILISYSGFRAPAIQRVEQKTKRSILLVNGDEIERAIEHDGDLIRMLRQKRETLRVHSKVAFLPAHSQKAHHRTRDTLPSAPESFMFRKDERSKVLECAGSYGQFTFMRELPDIDWVAGGGLGISLDVGTNATNESGILGVLDELAKLSWVTHKGRWSIQQATMTWHGAGADAFATALSDWKNRYEALDRVHHTEEFCYVDICDDLGFYSFTGQVAAHSPRTVWQSSASFQLSGIPINIEPLRHLYSVLDPSSEPFFRPREGGSVTRHHLVSGQRRILDVLGVIVEEDELETDAAEREWVVGVVARNPFWAKARSRKSVPSWWPSIVSESESLVCALRSWHPVNHPKSSYRLWSCETAWTSDALAVCFVADWDDDPDAMGPVLESRPGRDRPPRSLETLVEPPITTR